MDPHAVSRRLAKFGLHLPIPSLDFLAGLHDIGPLLVDRGAARHLQLHRGHEQRRERRAPPATSSICARCCWPTASARWPARCSARRFRRRSISAIPAGRRSAAASAIRWRPGSSSRWCASLGLTALLLAVVPLVSILPILLYIGLVIGAQAFETTPARHAPAVILAMLPNIASWAQSQIDGALAAAGHVGGAGRARQARRQRRDLSRAGTVRRRRHAGRADARRDRRVHHRPPLRSRRDLCARRRRCSRSSASSTAPRSASAIRRRSHLAI